MGLEATIRAGVATAFKAVGDLKLGEGDNVSGTLVRLTGTNYDSNVMEDVDTTEQDAFQGIELKFSGKDIDGVNVLSGDKKLLIQDAELTAPPVENRDHILLGTEQWEIKKVDSIPTGAMHILQIRKVR